MRRCIQILTAIALVAWSAPGFGEEAESPPAAPEATEEPEAPPDEGAEGAPEGDAEGEAETGEAESAPESDAETGEAEAETAEAETGSAASEPEDVENPFAEPVEQPPVEQTPVEEAEQLPPPPLETVAPDLGDGEDEAAGDSTDAPAETEERERIGTEEQYTDSLPFRNSRLIYENVFAAAQLDRGYEQTYNPYYAMSLSIQPRWYFTDQLSLRLRFDVEGELTDSDVTTRYHETWVSDLTLDLVYSPIFTIPGLDVTVGAGLRAQFPTSHASQTETRYMGLGPDLRLGRVFDVLDGLVFAYSFRYMKYLNRYTSHQMDTNPYSCPTRSPECLAFQQSGQMSRNHGFFNTLLLAVDFLRDQWRPMNFAIMVSFINYLNYEPPSATIDSGIGGSNIDVANNPDSVNHLAYVMYVMELSLEITDYLGLAIGTLTLNNQLAPDSTYRTPFFNRHTTVYVDLSLDLERLVAAFRQ